MKNIIDIYENNLYNGILSTNGIDNMDNDIKKVYDTYYEKILKIITLSCQLDDAQEKLFRKTLKSFVHKYTYCKLAFSPVLRDVLIKLSNHKLNKNDFSGIYINKKEYDFMLWLEYQFITNNNPNFETYIKHDCLISAKEKFVKCDNTLIATFNNIKFCIYEYTGICILYIELPNNYRIYIQFTNILNSNKAIRKLF